MMNAFMTSRQRGPRALVAGLLTVLVLLLSSAHAQDEKPWRALYRGASAGDTLWLDLTVQAAAAPESGSGATTTPSVDARLLFQHRVLLGQGSIDDHGRIQLDIFEADGDRGEPGAPAGAGTRVGSFDGHRSEASNDDGNTLEGTLTLAARDEPLTMHRVAQYENWTYQLGPVEGSLGLPRFLSGSWQPHNSVIASEARGAFEAFLTEGAAALAEQELWRGWIAYDDISVQGISDELLSLLRQRYEYTGGAHGNYSYETRTYVWDDGVPRALDLDALLLPGPEVRAALQESVLNELRHQNASWVVSGDARTLTDDDLALFNLTPAGLQFVFPPYAMGPYVEGTYSVTIPYAVAREWAPTDGWLARFAGPPSP